MFFFFIIIIRTRYCNQATEPIENLAETRIPSAALEYVNTYYIIDHL